VLRSPHADKTSRDQLEIRTHLRLMDIIDPTDKTVDALNEARSARGSRCRDQAVRAVAAQFNRRPIAVGTFWKKGKKMTLGLVGRKVGMTRVFHRRRRLAAGDGAGRVRQPRDADQVLRDRRLQRRAVTFGKRPRPRVNKAAAGHLAKAAVEAGHVLRRIPRAGRRARQISSSAEKSASTSSR